MRRSETAATGLTALDCSAERTPFMQAQNHNQPMADAEGNSFGAAARAELAHDRGDVELNGMLGNPQARSDLLIAQARREELQNLQFARCEGLH